MNKTTKNNKSVIPLFLAIVIANSIHKMLYYTSIKNFNVYNFIKIEEKYNHYFFNIMTLIFCDNKKVKNIFNNQIDKSKILQMIASAKNYIEIVCLNANLMKLKEILRLSFNK